MGPREAQIQSATTTRELNTQGLETYRNDAYGFAFQYPGTWGKVAFAEASPKQRRGDAAELAKLSTPDSGVIFRGSFEGKKYCEFGGLSDDYSYPSETPIFAWKPSGGKYYDVSSGAGKAYVSEVTPEQVSNDNELLGSLGGGVLFVNIELPGPVVHSIGFFCYGTGQDGQVLDSDRNEMKIITQTFQYVPTIK